MAKIKFADINFSKARLEMLAKVNSILEEYRKQGLTLTLRQAYYQLVSRDIIPNNDKEYKRLGALLTDGRMAGIVDWNALEDRVRVPKIPWYVNGIPQALQTIVDQYRLDRQEGQDNYVEVWIEKDALSNIMARVTTHYHVQLMVNRGYSSCSAMYESSKRFKIAERFGQTPHILYFGDHDPSGLDMVRDVRERLATFGVEVEVKQVALTTAQVRQFNPPPNPAKITDSRADWYIEKYGPLSWELDALPPMELDRLLREALDELVDMDLFEEVVEKENSHIERLKAFIEEAGEI